MRPNDSTERSTNVVHDDTLNDDKSGVMDPGLLRLLDAADQDALWGFLQSIGCQKVSLLDDLQLVEATDLKESSLSKILQRKVLLIKEFMELGGSAGDVENLQQVKKGIQTMRASATAKSPPPAKTTDETEDIVHLNVGGNRFTTTRKTLCRVPGSVLESMFSGRFPNAAPRMEDGTYVIDRDGSQFAHVLNFLRVGTVVSLPKEQEERQLLAMEADYYGLEGIVTAIQCPLSIDITEHLPESVLEIWREEDAIRAAFLEDGGKSLDRHEGLVSVFKNLRPLPYRYRPMSAANESVPKLMDLRKGGLQMDQAVTVTSIEIFQTNFNKEHANFLNRMIRILREEPVIIAGGSVLRALTVDESLRDPSWWESGMSDIDVFIHSCDAPEEATRIARRIFYALAADDERWIIVRGRGVIAMHTWNMAEWKADKKTQVVLRLYDSPAEVLYGFDVDCCACAFDGHNVWATPRCLQAIQTGINYLNPLHAWPNRPSYEIRLAKYASRGYAVAVPGLDEGCIDPHEISSTSLGKSKGLARLLKVAYSMEKDACSSSPGEPLRRSDLKEAAKSSMTDCEQLISGYWDGDSLEELERPVTTMIVPPVYGEDEDRTGYPLWWRPGYFDEEYFPIASQIRDRAWEGIENAVDDELPNDIPRSLDEAWHFEKKSREYLNASMDRIDLDSLYFRHVCAKKNRFFS